MAIPIVLIKQKVLNNDLLINEEKIYMQRKKTLTKMLNVNSR